MIVPRFARPLVAILCYLSPAIALAQSPAVAEIQAARLAQNAAIAARRMDSVASFWTNDVVTTTSLGRVFRGKDAYRQGLVSDSGMIYGRTPVSIETATPWQSAWEEGQWVGIQGRGGPVVIRGRYAAQWHRVGTRWLIRSEVFVALSCSGAACQRPLATP